eukprot:2296045-Pyramimonas_sp.AAC.1
MSTPHAPEGRTYVGVTSGAKCDLEYCGAIRMICGKGSRAAYNVGLGQVKITETPTGKEKWTGRGRQTPLVAI